MNYIKLQQDILKALYNDKTRNDFIFVDKVVNDRVWVVYKGVAVYSIPERMCFLDRKAIENWTNRTPYVQSIVDSLMKHVGKGYILKFTGVDVSGKLKCNRYEHEYVDFKVHCDVKLMKYSEPEYEQYVARDSSNPMFVKDGGEVVAIILPVKGFK